MFTSPPYTTVRLEDDPWGKTYFQDMENIFREIKTKLNPGATIVVEVIKYQKQKWNPHLSLAVWGPVIFNLYV